MRQKIGESILVVTIASWVGGVFTQVVSNNFARKTFHPETWGRFGLGILTHTSLDLQAPSEYNF